MKRLTMRNSDGKVSQPYGVTVDEVFYRLAEYEDTGIKPEEIKDNMDMFHAYRHVCAGNEPEHIRELLQAEQDGRLVVLPCKVGDVVYGIHQEYTILPMVVKWIETNAGWNFAAQYTPMAPKFYRFDDVGKTVFLTREEAEAAIAKKGGNQ